MKTTENNDGNDDDVIKTLILLKFFVNIYLIIIG